MSLGRCETCSNEAEKLFEVIVCGQSHAYDSFQCAVMAMAHRCDFCGLSISTPVMEHNGRHFCSSSCAEAVDD